MKLPKPTLKNARLVSKQWRDTTDIVLWARISTDLTGDDKRKMDYILDSKSCGILDNLKSLTITTRSRDLDSQKDASTSLLRLLVAIPPDNLASFVCTQFRISRHVAGSLIRLQSKLSVLSICVDDPTSAGIPGTDYVTGNLSKLHTIAIHSVGDDIKTYEGYRQWFPHMPGLRDLAVKGQMRATRNDFSGWVPHPSAPLLRLRSIILVNLRLLESSESMSSLTNLNFLKMLEFRKCQNVAPLLTSLARAFEENGSVLTHFLCSARQFPNEAVVACQRLFRSVTTLIWIDICVDHANALPSIESLESNFESLELLAWSTIDSGKGFALSELELLTRQCPRLEQLYVGLGDLRGSIDTIDASEHFDIRNTNDHINLLVGCYSSFIWQPTNKRAVSDRTYEATSHIGSDGPASVAGQELAVSGSRERDLRIPCANGLRCRLSTIRSCFKTRSP